MWVLWHHASCVAKLLSLYQEWEVAAVGVEIAKKLEVSLCEILDEKMRQRVIKAYAKQNLKK